MNAILSFYKPEACEAVLNGVVIKLFGVETTSRFGVTPLKSDSWRGVFSPPFRGVSTFDKAIIFCASCNYILTKKVTIMKKVTFEL